MVYIKTLFDWKRSKYVPSLDNIIKLAKFFDCSVDKDKSICARHIAVRLIFYLRTKALGDQSFFTLIFDCL